VLLSALFEFLNRRKCNALGNFLLGCFATILGLLDEGEKEGEGGG